MLFLLIALSVYVICISCAGGFLLPVLLLVDKSQGTGIKDAESLDLQRVKLRKTLFTSHLSICKSLNSLG